MWARTLVRGSLLASAMMVACGGDPPPSFDGVGDAIPPPMPRAIEAADALYDGEGVPLPSDTVVAGLALPRGIDEVEALGDERRHFYTSRIPPDRLLRYFGPRLTTVDIRHERDVVTYRAAVPRGVRGGVVRLDVTVRPSSEHAARVEIYEIPPPAPAGRVVPAEEIERHLKQQASQRRE